MIQNATTANGGTGSTGTLNSWSLSFQKLLPTTGLGVAGADNVTESFRHLHARSGRCPFGPSVDTGRPGGHHRGGPAALVRMAVDPSDPSGNTVYAAGASGGSGRRPTS